MIRLDREFDLQFFADGWDGDAPEGGAESSDTMLGGHDGDDDWDGGAEDAPAKPAARETDVPSDYSFAVPEGMEISPETQREFGELAQRLGLTQRQAQKLVDYHAKHWIGAVQELERRMERQVEEWGAQTRSHPEFGGPRFEESLGYARRFIDRFGGQSLRDALNESGAGNHPELFAAFARAGRLISEDRHARGRASGGGAGDSPRDVARRVYGGIRM